MKEPAEGSNVSRCTFHAASVKGRRSDVPRLAGLADLRKPLACSAGIE